MYEMSQEFVRELKAAMTENGLDSIHMLTLSLTTQWIIHKLPRTLTHYLPTESLSKVLKLANARHIPTNEDVRDAMNTAVAAILAKGMSGVRLRTL